MGQCIFETYSRQDKTHVKLSVQDLRLRKKNGPKIVMLTSYDFPTAALEDRLGVDVQREQREHGEIERVNREHCADDIRR